MILLGLGIQFPWWLSIAFLTFWAIFFLLDVKSTIRIEEFIKYETNVLVRLFSKKFTPTHSLALQIIFEIIIIFTGSFFDLRLDLSPAGIISLVFGIMHMTAWHSNKKFIAK